MVTKAGYNSLMSKKFNIGIIYCLAHPKRFFTRAAQAQPAQENSSNP